MRELKVVEPDQQTLGQRGLQCVTTQVQSLKGAVFFDTEW